MHFTWQKIALKMASTMQQYVIFKNGILIIEEKTCQRKNSENFVIKGFRLEVKGTILPEI